MNIIQYLFLIVIWGIPIVLLAKIYFKMGNEEKERFISELKKPRVFLNIGLISMGVLLFFSGFISATKSLQHIGAILILISWFTTIIISYRKRITDLTKSSALVLLGVIGVVAYGYLF